MKRRTGPRRAIRLTPDTLPYIFEWAPGKCYWRDGQVTAYRVFTGRQQSQVAQWGDLVVERHDGSFYVASSSDSAARAVEDQPGLRDYDAPPGKRATVNVVDAL